MCLLVDKFLTFAHSADLLKDFKFILVIHWNKLIGSVPIDCSPYCPSY